MKYNKIMTVFGVTLLSSVVLRILQLFFVVEKTTGFFVKEYKSIGNIMLVLIFVFSFAAAFFASYSHRSPEHPPRSNIALSIASFLPAAALFWQLLSETYPTAIPAWQINSLKITGFACGVFFIAYGLQHFVQFPLPKISFVLPTIYFIIRVICDFTAISSLALISDNLILITAYCALLWFMLQLAKLYNGADTEKGFRKLMAGGILSVILCFTQSVPHIILNFVSGNSYLHTSFQTNISLLFTGVFVLVFMLSHFSHKNSCV